MAIQAFDKSLFCCVNDKDIYALEVIPAHEEKSKEMDGDYHKPQPRKRYIPPMSHPWKKAPYEKSVRSQKHHNNTLPAA